MVAFLALHYVFYPLALIVFGILEFWPRHLPSWLPRWLFQTNPDSDASMRASVKESR